MHQYGVREVEKLLRLPRSTIRTFVEAGFVSPSRGPRNAWQFSFQDLIVLRTAQALANSNVPRQRITRSVKELRRHLPDSMPLSGLSIGAVGDRVVVKEGANRWQADSGQYLLAFEGDPDAGSLSVFEEPSRSPRARSNKREEPGPFREELAELQGQTGRPADASEWFDKGAALEKWDIAAAVHAYGQAIATDPALVTARINLGGLLHEAGRHAEAERVYRDAIEANSADAVLFYNLGVLLEDMERKTEAVAAYQAALRRDPDLADCHYNLALLCAELKKPKDAIRHMAQYRKLTGKA